MPSSPQIAKTYRRLWTGDGGRVCYQSVNDPEGHELLYVNPDGTTYSYTIVGICSPCAGYGFPGEVCVPAKNCSDRKLAYAPERVAAPAPARTPELVSAPPPYRAPEPEPEPEAEIPPVADEVAQVARTLATQIWGMGLMPRAELAPANDQCLAHAVHENGWLLMRGTGSLEARSILGQWL